MGKREDGKRWKEETKTERMNRMFRELTEGRLLVCRMRGKPTP